MIVGCKWIFKKKEGIPGVEEPRYKASLVAKDSHRWRAYTVMKFSHLWSNTDLSELF